MGGTDDEARRYQQMLGLITGCWVSQTVGSAAALSVADRLAVGPLTAQEIATAEGSDPSATFRLLRACTALGLLTYDTTTARFAGTALLETLRRDSPNSLRNLALMVTAPGQWLCWGRFTDTVRAGSTQFEAALGSPDVWTYRAQNPDEGRLFAPGDFFDSVPAADMYLLKSILHDWDDDSCVRILRNVRSAMPQAGRVVIVEMLVGEAADPGFGTLMDMHMLAMLDGKERDLTEFDALLEAAGLQRTALTHLPPPHVVIEAAGTEAAG